MHDQDIVRQRIIDRAVGLFAHQGLNDDELFTTKHYAQAVKSEFSMSLDAENCNRHLEAMDGIENAIGCIWRRLTKQTHSDNSGERTSTIVKACVLRLLADSNRFYGKWLSTEILAAALKYDVVMDCKAATDAICDKDGDIVDLVNCALHTMVADGRVVQQRILQHIPPPDGRGTMFRLAVKDEEILGDVRHLLN